MPDDVIKAIVDSETGQVGGGADTQHWQQPPADLTGFVRTASDERRRSAYTTLRRAAHIL